MTDAAPLPAAYELDRILAARPGVQVLRARRGEERVVLRLDLDAAAAEGRAELAVLGRVEHPGIAPLLDHGPLPGGGQFLARRWVDGEDLLTWSRGREPEEIGRVVGRLCAALDHLHGHGFVHGDLKPENVIVAEDGRPVLCDFGLAHASGRGRTGEGVTGTPFHIPPEELLGLEATWRADLFALGALLHRLLTPSTTSASEFYARFPSRSFLDAVGTDLEALPTWARDLVAALTARDPLRRPTSAGVVGRLLADRLGGIETSEAAPRLRWTSGEGRAPWTDRWLREEEPDVGLGRWVRVSAREEARGFWEHLRLRASLVGRPSVGVDLATELRALETGGATDAWAAEHAARENAWLLVHVDRLDASVARALRVLAVACTQQRERASREGPTRGPVVTVVSAAAPEGEGWKLEDVPPVEGPAIARFLAGHFRSEEAARLEELANRLARAAAGSASELDRVLENAQREGHFLPTDRGFRLRPGELPELAPDHGAASEESRAQLGDDEQDLLTALTISGRRVTADHLLELLGWDAEAFGDQMVALQTDGWIDRVRLDDQSFVILKRPCWNPARAAVFHTRRAALESVPAWTRRMHAFCARPCSETAASLAAELAALRDAGKAELALSACDELRSLADALDVSLSSAAPEVLAEEARSWRSIGQTEHALRVAGQIAAEGDERIGARAELVFAEVAAIRNQTDAALAHFERAVLLDPESTLEATIGRIQLLHEKGRDEEVLTAARDLAPRELEKQGRLGSRERAHVEYLSAMSAFRLGDVEGARSTTAALREEAHERGDAGLEAALCINLSIIDRRTGHLERAREELEDCIELYERSGRIAGIAHARATMGGLLREMGELAPAEPLLISAMEIRERLGDTNGARVARGMLGLLHFERGHARAAIEILESTAASLEGAQKLRHAPFLFAKAAEMRRRIGAEAAAATVSEEGTDPRILLARARIAWMNEEPDAARALAERAAELAASLNLARLQDEARWVEERASGAPTAPVGDDETDLLAADRRVHALLSRTGTAFDQRAVHSLALELEEHGRDDRAARLWLALAARTNDAELAKVVAERAEDALERCARGLTPPEKEACRRHLLGEPDPWPGDFTHRIDPEANAEELEMEIVSLLGINRQLAQQNNLDTLLGVIVEHALEVTGGERGFLVLEEHGELRFDTALDSCRGDIAQPEFEISRSVVRRALDEGQPILVSNAVDDPLLAHQSSVVSLELRSILCVPIDISDSLRGAIYVDHRLRTGAFDGRAEKLCSLLADQAALAIQQVRRLDEIRNLNRALEQRVVRGEADLRSARRALRATPHDAFAGLIGSSPEMQRVKDLIEKAAPSSLPILIVGESGTGKEIAARAVHDHSARQDGPFVSESCAAIPPSLIESELFGAKKGAYTGADQDRIGLIEQADGGTLFLDEIGEMPHELQAKLLRVLETGEVRRLGEEATRQVDFRLVVATNRDLEREIEENRFREDLYYRLNGVRVDMPPLSRRTADIPLLVNHFLDLEAGSGPRRQISRSVLSALAQRRWPGNVRELRNEIARMCVLTDGPLDDPSLVSTPARARSEEATGEITPLAQIERQAILAAIEHTGGDKPRAAELLGISRAKIYQRLKEWNEATD